MLIAARSSSTAANMMAIMMNERWVATSLPEMAR